jgi:hypothetical protein
MKDHVENVPYWQAMQLFPLRDILILPFYPHAVPQLFLMII